MLKLSSTICVMLIGGVNSATWNSSEALTPTNTVGNNGSWEEYS